MPDIMGDKPNLKVRQGHGSCISSMQCVCVHMCVQTGGTHLLANGEGVQLCNKAVFSKGPFVAHSVRMQNL